MKLDEMRGKITRLLVNNNEFAQLEASLHAFNPLKVLNIQEHELENLYTLSWLLKPQANHQLGDYFLKQLIKSILIKNEEIASTVSLAPVTLQLSNFYDAKVYMDWRSPRNAKKIDLLIVSKVNKLVIMLLHKRVKDSLAYHHQECMALVKNNKEFEGFQILPVYFTDTGEEPPHRDFCRLTHEDLANLIEGTLLHHHGQLNGQVEQFLKNYLEFIREVSIQSEDKILLCRELYREHYETINWILEESKDVHNREMKEMCKEILHQYTPILRYILREGKEDPFVTAMEKFLDDKLTISLSTKRLKNTELWFYPIELSILIGILHIQFLISLKRKKKN
jgi:hypothetical protein